MAHPRRWRVLQDLRDGGAELVESATVDAIEADAVRYRAGDVEHRAPADTVIVTTGLAANPSLADALREAGIEPQVIGDVTGVGYIEGAIHEGFHAGLGV